MRSESGKISIIGAGQVGAEVGFALAESALAQEIVLVDLERERAEGVALDIAHGVAAMPPVEVRPGEYADIAGSQLVILAAGAGQKPGEDRRALAGRNRIVVECASREIARNAPDCVLIVVTNPVDVLTSAAILTTGFEPWRVIGSGTLLDSLRFRAMIAAEAGVDARDVQAWVLGEHGDSSVPAWSAVRIGGLGVDEFCRACGDCGLGLERRLRERFDGEVRGAAYRIIRGKGATSHGVAVAVRRIAQAVLRDEHAVLTVSTRLHGECGIEDVALSLPCAVGACGIERVLPPALTPTELIALQGSADAIKGTALEAELQLI